MKIIALTLFALVLSGLVYVYFKLNSDTPAQVFVPASVQPSSPPSVTSSIPSSVQPTEMQATFQSQVTVKPNFTYSEQEQSQMTPDSPIQTQVNRN